MQPSGHNRHTITQKITYDYIDPVQNEYKYEGFGTDHQRITEDKKERVREAMRKKVETQLTQYKKNNREKDKLLNLNMNNGGNLNMPSFHKNAFDKDQYRNTLLKQMEDNKERKLKTREEERRSIKSARNDFAKGEYVDRFAERRGNQKREYYASVNCRESKKLEKAKEKMKERNDMKSEVDKYQRQVKNDRSKKQVNNH